MAVFPALVLGTMVGSKRIVVTMGEKIGKEHLTYAQGACAGLVAPFLPPTTSVGVAGTMAANRSGLQLPTLRNIAATWVFTPPARALLSGLLYAAFRSMAGN